MKIRVTIQLRLPQLAVCGQSVTETEGIYVPESKINIITNTVTEATCSVNNGVAVVYC